MSREFFRGLEADLRDEERNQHHDDEERVRRIGVALMSLREVMKSRAAIEQTGEIMSFAPNRRTFLKTAAAASVAEFPPLVSAERALDVFGTSSGGALASATVRPLMLPNLAHSLAVRCLSKQVFASQSIDDMETDRGWIASSTLELSYTEERAKIGKRSMRFSTLMRNEEFIRATRTDRGFFTGKEVNFAGQPFTAFAILNFAAPQDWSAFNRISMWCYLHPNTNPANSISLQFLCEGASAGPSDPISIHFIGDLKSGQWNLLTWEISEFPRNRITQFILFKPTSGLPVKGADPRITFDFDQLQLERVEVEPVGGWSVTPGKISYSHYGYTAGAEKLAFCSDADHTAFRLVDEVSGIVAAELPVTGLTNSRGTYSVLNFTSFSKPGTYRLECGSAKSESFPIGDGVLNLLVDATLNSFTAFRCGCAASGAHDACHLDTFVEYKGDRRTMAGGWHDAANNTQWSDSTHLSVLALLRLYENLVANPVQRARSARALDEAKWGLDWCLRMRFAAGVRNPKNFTSYWTDSVVGTVDDVVQTNAGRNLRENIFALAALSSAARVLAHAEPTVAGKARAAAEEDYQSIRMEVAAPLVTTDFGDAGRGTWRDLVAYLTLSAVELYRATSKPAYREDAIRFGGWLTDLQEVTFVNGSPVTGYFYSDQARTQIQRELYGSCDDSGPLALKALCEALPDDVSWMRWYASLLIYSEYYCLQGSLASAPFQVIPSAVWREEDLDKDIRPDLIGGKLEGGPSPIFPTAPTLETTKHQMREMYDAGAPLAPNMRLRVFPIWYNHVQHGSTTAQLCRAAGLGCAAEVRGDLRSAELAVRQLQWVVGANPFSRSLLYGIGYDYWQNFTVDNINFVGGLGLGMNSYKDDAPAWPNNAVFPYKEQWSYSTGRMALNLAQCGTSARIVSHANAAMNIREERTGRVTHLRAGPVDCSLPQGRYVITSDQSEWRLDAVAGRTYRLTFERRAAVGIVLTHAPGSSQSEIMLTGRLNGSGTHTFKLKLYNCRASRLEETVVLENGAPQELHWTLNVIEKTTPWIAVVIPTSQPDLRVEAYGRVGTFQDLS